MDIPAYPGRICRNRFGVAKIGDYRQMSGAHGEFFWIFRVRQVIVVK